MPIVCAFATSHAYTFEPPENWGRRRERSRANVAKKNAGRLAPDTPEAQAETLEDNLARYARIRDAHEKIRERLLRSGADAVLMIGDDQDENFHSDNRPQLLVFTGPEFVAEDWDRKESATIAGRPEVAQKLVSGLNAEGFDVCHSDAFREGRLLSHAHVEPTLYLVRDSGIPVVPV